MRAQMCCLGRPLIDFGGKTLMDAAMVQQSAGGIVTASSFATKSLWCENAL
jgi:hypothetical protein